MIQNVFILGATGNVGKELVTQIIEKGDTEYGIHVNPTRIIGLASSKEFIYLKEGISSKNAFKFINKNSENSKIYQSLKEILHAINKDKEIYNKNKLVFIDVTALKGQEINDFHLNIVKNTDFDLVTANKNPISLGDFKLFQELTQNPLKYGYRCTVMAGSDTVSLLQDLRDVSDPIHSIEGCFSGTLGYITSELEKNISFSEIVKNAYSKGYTEPHPRDDLNGLDVARKILILARGMGYNLNMSDLKVEPLVPKELLLEDDPNLFLESLKSLNDEYIRKIKNTQKNGNTLRYVGEIIIKNEKEEINIKLKEVPINSPLGSLQGTLNKIVVQSDYYNPLYAIEAPGAGVKITASNIRRNLLYLLDGRRFLLKH